MEQGVVVLGDILEKKTTGNGKWPSYLSLFYYTRPLTVDNPGLCNGSVVICLQICYFHFNHSTFNFQIFQSVGSSNLQI